MNHTGHPFRIIGTGSELPDTVVTNDMLAAIVDTSDEWIRTRTGISERRMSAGEATWELGAAAARKALKAAELNGSDIDLILVSTCTPDYFVPTTSCIIQAEIDADRALCVDINVACSGFLYALDAARRYLADEQIQHVLVVACESLSKIVDFTRRSTCVLFGDGAGAVVLRRSREGESSAWLGAHLGARGKQAEFLVSAALPVRHPFLDPEQLHPPRYGERHNSYLTMNGPEVFKFAVHALVESVNQVIVDAGLTIEQIHRIVPHQANTRIVDAAAKRLGAKPEQLVDRLSKMGNTSSASIPIVLDEIVRTGQIRRGDRIVFCGFGAGLTYGAALIVF